jgi:hypothetical protein
VDDRTPYISSYGICEDASVTEPVAAQPTLKTTNVKPSLGRLAEPLRDIARGGLAGLLTGILVAGVGGRIVMRAAALLVPEATGRFTENGNRIGSITLSGTLGLVIVAGLFFGLAGATIWVVVSPWLPGGARRRALAAMPVAVALAGVALVQASNADFRVLRHDVATVALLLGLVAVAGLTISLIDSWLDRRLPAANASALADATYLAISAAGAVLVFPVVIASYVFGEGPLGLALVATGIATLVLWVRRYRGEPPRPPWLVAAGRICLLGAVVLGVVALLPDVATAIGA